MSSGSPRFPPQLGAAIAVAALVAGTALVYSHSGPGGLRPGVVQMNDMLAVADAKRGAEIAQSCVICHSFQPVFVPGKTGPHLFGIVGRPMASVEGYAYSVALSELRGETWTTDNLYDWLHDPTSFAPGTTMAVEGMLDPQDRMDLIAYLITVR